MLMRWVLGIALILILWGSKGCSPKARVGGDEDKNPYLLAGRDWMASGNAAKARHNLEQALIVNPRSPLAHYEMGLLNERFERDYVSAIYHYRQAMRLRPDGYPSDNAKGRIESCKQELVKGELLAPVAQDMVRELDRLRKENAQLKAEMENVPIRTAAHRSSSQASPVRNPAAAQGASAGSTAEVRPTAMASVNSPASAKARRTHAVQRGETVYSIARQYSVTQAQLLQANPGLNPRALPVGKKLQIPGAP